MINLWFAGQVTKEDWFRRMHVSESAGNKGAQSQSCARGVGRYQGPRHVSLPPKLFRQHLVAPGHDDFLEQNGGDRRLGMSGVSDDRRLGMSGVSDRTR